MGRSAGEAGVAKKVACGGSSPLHILACLGFACLIGWELSTVFAPALPLLAGLRMEEALSLRALSVLALALTFAAFAAKADAVFVHRNRLLVGLSLLSLLTPMGALFGALGIPLPLPTLAVLWVLLGVGQASVMGYWCAFFSLVPTRHTTANIAVGSAVGTILFVVVNASGVVWVAALETALLMLGSVGVVRFLSAQIPPETIPEVEEFHRTPALSPAASLSVGCCGVVYGFMAIELCAMGPAAALVGGASGFAGVLLVMLWARLGSHVDIDVGVVQRIALPPLVASVLLFPIFEGPVRIACACLAIMALAHSQLFAWYSLSIDNHEFRLHPVGRFALRQIPSWVGFFVGVVFAFVLTFVVRAEGAPFYLAMALFAIAVVVAFSVYGGDESKTKARLDELLKAAAGTAVALVQDEADIEGGRAQGSAGESAFDPMVSGFQQRCDRVCEKYSLTPRESEVFFLLAKGRNAEHISNQLVVTPATVKSHIYHIYRKLGINSQQHLMDLVDDCETSPNCAATARER